MKWIAGILLALNLGLAGYFAMRAHGPRGAAEPFAPLNVDKLSLAAGPAAPAPASPPAEPARAVALCVEWRGLEAGEFEQVREQLKALAGTRPMSFIEIPLNTRRWVIFPPLPSARSAAEKLDELVAAGVRDAFVVKDGPWRNAISLGLYANDAAAARRTTELEAKGVHGTRVEQVARHGTEFLFLVRSEDPEVLKSLNDLRQPYPDSRLSRIACPS